MSNVYLHPRYCGRFYSAVDNVVLGIRDASLEVPDEVAMVAFDDLPAAMVVDPFLTAAVQPAYEMGRRAAELLLARLEGTEAGPAQEILMPVELVVRHSSGTRLG